MSALKLLPTFLRKHSHNVYTVKKAIEILSYISKDGDTTTEYQDMRDFVVKTAVKQLKDSQKVIVSIEEEIKRMLPMFDCTLETMPGISFVTAAALIAEVGDINRFTSPAKLKICGCKSCSIFIRTK